MLVFIETLMLTFNYVTSKKKSFLNYYCRFCLSFNAYYTLTALIIRFIIFTLHLQPRFNKCGVFCGF